MMRMVGTPARLQQLIHSSTLKAWMPTKRFQSTAAGAASSTAEGAVTAKVTKSKTETALTTGLLLGGAATAIYGISSYSTSKEDEPTVGLDPQKLRAYQALDPIRAHQEVKLPPNASQGYISSCHINTFAANEPCEDRYQIEYAPEGASYFLVADGHTGTEASQYAKNKLIQWVRWSLSNRPRTDSTDPLAIEKDDISAIRKGFQQADKQFLEYHLRQKEKRGGLAGACLNMAIIHKAHLYVANAGDCRAVIATRSEGKLKAVPLSEDHTGETEIERLRAEHTDDPDVVVRGRIKGRLQPSRGLGDGLYKLPEYSQVYRDTRNRELAKKWNPPYTTADPVVKSVPLTDRDEFVILATDGLWDHLSNDEAVSIVDSYKVRMLLNSKLSVRQKDVERNASTALIMRALEIAAKSSIDKGKIQTQGEMKGDITRQDKLENYILKLEPKQKRRVHDDITVLVVFLNRSKLKKEAEPTSRLPDPPQPLETPTPEG
ncbi:hypothetical protein PROFUN_00435 [Planoprotostelium fungivorum]|uniref:PPM-type phosphatase domain-containing protein n=1 Tax=Planoprotostelium fungivorum TaxID=1890364 RepID=A0A2P6N0U8_9EUKA|nr:hypothetical protein PROFUN_00435 [Planoprotostelium fungivorum]